MRLATLALALLLGACAARPPGGGLFCRTPPYEHEGFSLTELDESPAGDMCASYQKPTRAGVREVVTCRLACGPWRVISDDLAPMPKTKAPTL